MPILYTLVARGSVILAEFSGSSSNASTIARQILDKIPGTNDMNVSYSQDRYIFHVKRTDGLSILCMADDLAGSKANSLLLIFCYVYSLWIYIYIYERLWLYDRCFVIMLACFMLRIWFVLVRDAYGSSLNNYMSYIYRSYTYA